MNAWLIAATILLAGIVPCGVVCLRGSRLDALAGFELAATVVTVVLLLLAEGYHRSVYFVLPLTLAALSFVGGLVFVRFLERDL